MKKYIPVLFFGFSGFVAAADNLEIYTSEEYCQLQAESSGWYEKQYVKAYAKKLGQVPSKTLCKKIKQESLTVADNSDSNWDYRFRKPYKGSVRTLSLPTIAKLREAKVDGSSL
ncbi:hypothetical protein [Aliikangiella maris]|uniref:DUF5329 domain-containing protein n=2 Tax=Aliikangiella maris TaxID=3162458 RepID=A0ABV3MU57_9GAMM